MEELTKCGIPKVIYFFWLGPNKMPPLCEKCISSWHKFMPGYKIVKVDDSMVNLHANKFVEKAIEAKRWGYAVDYLRLAWMYEHGGIYFDTDVELLKSIDDIVERSEFFAFQEKKIACGLGFAVKQHSPVIKDLMMIYNVWDYETFIGKNGFPNIAPAPDTNSPIFLKMGLKEDDSLQVLNDITFYPESYFSPQSFRTRELEIKKETVAIHHGTGLCNTPNDLWMNRYRAKMLRKNKKIEQSYVKYQVRLYLFHPIRALKYHFDHRNK